MLYWMVLAVCNLLLRIGFRLRVYGSEHIPLSGAVIVCANHTSWLDPVVVGCTMRRRVNFMSKRELFKIPVVGWILPSLGAYPVRRGQADPRAIKRSLSILGNDQIIGIFPEGTRSRDGKLKAGEAGVALLAARSGAVVIPAGISGRYRLFSPLTIRYGEPIKVGKRTENRSKIDKKATVAIMAAISGLIDGEDDE